MLLLPLLGWPGRHYQHRGIRQHDPLCPGAGPESWQSRGSAEKCQSAGRDIQQLNDTLGAAVVEEKNLLSEELTSVLTDLTTRIDTRLGEIQTQVETLLTEINIFQEEVQAYGSRLLLFYNLASFRLHLAVHLANLLTDLRHSQPMAGDQEEKGSDEVGTTPALDS